MYKQSSITGYAFSNELHELLSCEFLYFANSRALQAQQVVRTKTLSYISSKIIQQQELSFHITDNVDSSLEERVRNRHALQKANYIHFV